MMEKLPPEIFDSFLDDMAYTRPQMGFVIRRMGGKSLGIRLTIQFPVDHMGAKGRRFIINSDTKIIDDTIRFLNWSLWTRDKKLPPKFKLREWKVFAGPAMAWIEISLDREQ